jgi:hypothetical protein
VLAREQELNDNTCNNKNIKRVVQNINKYMHKFIGRARQWG